MPDVILVSACLLGANCKYNGENNFNSKIVNFLVNKNVFLTCPEVISGLGVPREKIFFTSGDGLDFVKRKNKITSSSGKDVSEQLLSGCKKIFMLSKKLKVTTAILKDRSPSCGVNFVYNKKGLVKGCGVLTAMLKKRKIKIFADTYF